jgi:transposase
VNLVLLVGVTAVLAQDSSRGKVLLKILFERIKKPRYRHWWRFCRLKLIWADGGYRGYRGELIEWVKRTLGWQLEIVAKVEGQRGFVALPRRWVVERTFAWLNRNRRLSKDYKRLAQTGEAFVYVAMIRLMVRKLAHG